VRSGGRGHGNHDAIEDSVPERMRRVGRLVVEGPLRCESRAVCGRLKVPLGSSAISSRPVGVWRERCFDAVGDVTRVIAGCSEEDEDADTAHAGPAGFERNVSPSIAFRFPLPLLMTLFRLPYAD